eukprot:TRINITY_DN10210_c0_g1_i1.p1 TRINITY_DN10210_c0_g1~~TRINITY_DN10210_c0_g1_i1.p1  ORF type:complete len:744 (+),score=177.27 TRINITY_DN10210_c0_g1_i1:183-2414(+)
MFNWFTPPKRASGVGQQTSLGGKKGSNVNNNGQKMLQPTLRSQLVDSCFVEGGGADGQPLLKRSSTAELESYSQVLGEGAYGVVKLRRHAKTGEPRAVKTVKMLEHWDIARLTREAEMMQNLDHPHILRIFGWHVANDHMVMVTEYCAGGELTKAIQKAREVEKKAVHQGWLSAAFQQLFEALAYCHDRGLVHRDIKSGNIMLMRVQKPGVSLFKTRPHCVLVDLGLAQIVDSKRSGWGFSKQGQEEVRGAGTACTMAPEVWYGDSGAKTDIWSLGIVLYEIFAQRLPFIPADPDDCSRETWVKLFKEHQIDWVPVMHAFGPDAKDLCFRMLQTDPRQRPAATDCLSHIWFERYLSSCPMDESQINDVQQLCESITYWPKLLPMHKAICLKLSSESIGTAKFAAIFSRIDTDNSGTLSQQELVGALTTTFGVETETAIRTAQALDYNGDGSCEYLEFAAACLSSLGEEYDILLLQEFCHLDNRCKGNLTRNNFGRLIARIKPLCLSRHLAFPDIDTDGDGFIDFLEFCEVFGRPGVDYLEFIKHRPREGLDYTEDRHFMAVAEVLLPEEVAKGFFKTGASTPEPEKTSAPAAKAAQPARPLSATPKAGPKAGGQPQHSKAASKAGAPQQVRKSSLGPGGPAAPKAAAVEKAKAAAVTPQARRQSADGATQSAAKAPAVKAKSPGTRATSKPPPNPANDDDPSLSFPARSVSEPNPQIPNKDREALLAGDARSRQSSRTRPKKV